MYRILFHGTDRQAYSRLKDGFPGNMDLRMETNKARLTAALKDIRPHGIVLPMSDPGPDDLMYLRKIVCDPGSPGVVVTAKFISAPQAVSCMRLGAWDCLTGSVSGDVVGASLSRMIRGDRSAVNRKTEAGCLIRGSSPAATELRERLRRYGGLDQDVLVTGETGAGKELAARTIHACSRRCSGPFNAVNCASYPDDLLSSELFGSRRGAFTGSIDRPGLFESSRGGTLFLDEIGELSLQGQAVLLRVLEEEAVRPMGSLRTIPIDVRVIAATNRNLREQMKTSLFRTDLFYRLGILGVTVPPLRKRREDIAVLAGDYLRSLENGTSWRLDSGALARLVRHNWPGNVRELHSVILKATLTARNGLILAHDVRFDPFAAF